MMVVFPVPAPASMSTLHARSRIAATRDASSAFGRCLVAGMLFPEVVLGDTPGETPRSRRRELPDSRLGRFHATRGTEIALLAPSRLRWVREHPRVEHLGGETEPLAA